MIIQYHLHTPDTGYVREFFTSLQRAIELSPLLIKGDPEFYTIVEISIESTGRRRKTGMFDVYGNAVQMKPLGMPAKT